MYKGSVSPIWCLSCFVVTDDTTKQTLVFYSYNVTSPPVASISSQKNISDSSKSYTEPAKFMDYLINNMTFCFSGMLFLDPTNRVYDVGAYNQYT
jgi:hypothetical protein